MKSSNQITHRYRAERKLGSGGMGIVLEATDLLKQEKVALKRILLNEDAKQSDAPTSIKNLRFAIAHEFRMLASLRHPNIISVLDYGFDNSEQPFYTMELLSETESLLSASHLDTTGIVHIIVELLQSLVYLHRRGIIHRDLKPGNVLIDEGGRVRVLDFGLSQRQGKYDEIAGTLEYIAPELFAGHALTPQADLYAVGVIAYQLFEQQHPFTPNDSKLIGRILYEPPKPFERDIPQDIKYIIQRLLSKDPDDRFSSAEAVITALSEAIGEPPPPETSEQREGFIQAAEFVGREAERKQLIEAVSTLKRAEVSDNIWLIGGESGVGKSRLLDEVRIQALINGITVLSGQAEESTQPPFHLWQNIVRELILMTPHQPDEVSVFQAVFGHIDTLIGKPIPSLPDNADIRKLFDTHLGMLLDRQTRPLLLLLEDLQWADEDLLPLISLTRQRQPNMMIIGTYRNDESRNLPQQFPQAKVITLERLTSTEIRALSKSILGEAGQQEHIVTLLDEETQGNAFFIVEVIRALAQNAGRLSAVGTVTIDQGIFTKGMRLIIQRRLQQIPEEYQSLLRAAAVQGRLLERDVLTAVHGGDIEDFLYTSSTAGVLDVRDNQWRFAHDKFREELLRLISDSEQKTLHQQIATAMEQTYDDPLSHAQKLAHHWSEAGIPARESPYLLQAAHTAFESSLFQGAWRWMQRASVINIWQYIEHTPQNKAHFLRRMGSTAYQLGSYDEAIQHHEEARDILIETGDKAALADVVGSLGDICALIGRMDEAAYHLEQGLAYALESGSDEHIGIVLMNKAAFEAQRGNLDEAIAIMKQSYEHIKRTDNEVQLAKALNNVAISYSIENNYEEALVHHQKAMTLRRRLNDKHGIISSATNIAMLNINHLNDLERAAELLDEASRIAEQLALYRERITVAASLGLLAEKQNRIDDARHYRLQSIRLARQVQNPVFLAEQLSGYSQFAYKQGDLQAAVNAIHEALEIRKRHKHTASQDELIGCTARLLTAYQELEAALVLLSYANTADALQSSEELLVLYEDLQKKLPDSAAQAAIEKGRRISREEITRWILDELLASKMS